MVERTRRQWLATCVGTGTAVLAGCSSASDDTSNVTDDGDNTTPTDSSDDGGSIGDEGGDDLSSDEWPMAGVDLENTGYHPTATGPTGPVSERWVFETDGRISGGAAIADQTVYVGSGNSYFYAMDINSGDKIWSTRIPAANYNSTPTISGDKIFVNDGAGDIVAFDREFGEIVWDTNSHNVRPVGSPSLINDIIYTNSDDGEVVGIARGSGDIKWRHEIDGRGSMTTAISNGILYAVGVPHHVYALDLESQERLWETETGSSTMGLAVGKDHVYAGAQKNETIYAFDPQNGEIIWESDVGSMILTSISYHSGDLFAGTRDGVISVGTEGAIRWENPAGGHRGNITLTNELLFTGSDDGVHALDRTGGEEIWYFQTDEYIHAAPSVVNDVLIVGTDAGDIYALE
ncbi:PQQ-binding-like beta-propeller repeat protein [Natronosalvus vescus]|uniref:outer membrane protein assembly factor BamB family protein n=1 Tax=Natronosalvus vescus TaxID=2953881 RepID=UPI00208FFBF1|nr:PQQ-binding-like beta-propeller repeat protein [Natronosalvus vescus]